MDYTNFEVGQKFPLPIREQGDGGLFQADVNGLMFILQLSRTDVIAWEAFRTGKMELALYEEDGVLFFLYQIDGIFKEGWGDAPLGLALLKPEEWPTEEILQDKTLHLYLVDSNLSVLLSLRQVQLDDGFHQVIRDYVAGQKGAKLSPKAYTEKVHRIWQGLTSAAMREKAVAVQKVPLALGH